MEGTENSSIGNSTEVKRKKWKNPFQKEEKLLRQKKKARLVVRNVSYKVKQEDLKKYFEKWGTVEEVNLLKVGCAFVQYATVNQATKAILKSNNQPLLGRPLYVDWAISKNEYLAKKGGEASVKKLKKAEIKEEEVDLNNSIKEEEVNGSDEAENGTESDDEVESGEEIAEDIEADSTDAEDPADAEDDDKKDVKDNLNMKNIKKEKHISNDVKEGCTIFIKNVPFDASETELRKVCRKFGPLFYCIINRESISGHSKGTAFVKFKTKESADLCLQSGTEFALLDQCLDPHPALSRDEITHQNAEKTKSDDNKDSRNLYLVREGLITSGSKAAEGVSASDMNKRHNLEQIKTQVLKNLNRFVSRNRLSIHNLPLNYDNEKLRQMAIAYTGLKPHECRVMRENKITPDHPKGKSKGFGFLSFNSHKDALMALRKLNNNPDIFGTLHRPILAFSIEDRAVHQIKEKRIEKSKLNNPTYQEKLKQKKELRKQKLAGKLKKTLNIPQNDDKEKLKKHIKKLEASRAAKSQENEKKTSEEYENFTGMVAKPGSSIRMRSNKKIQEQAQEHLKRVKTNKRKEKKRKIQRDHLNERKSIDRPKQGRKVERDDLSHLVRKYKSMIDKNASADSHATKLKKPKRTKWFME